MKSKKTISTFSINCNGDLVDLTTPKVLGIIHVTPDSFYDGGKFKDEKSLLKQAEKMLVDGADFIDVGAYSSRPGANFVSEVEELKRITPIVKLIIKSFPNCKISIDSFRSKVINECVGIGASISNDISAGKLDPMMMETVGRLNIPYIMMHMRGTPKTMQNKTNYKNIVNQVFEYFSERILTARHNKINDIIIDVGFGFAKTIEQNYVLLKKLNYFNSLNYPILTGISRKSMIYNLLDCSSSEALNGTTALNMVALINGSKILRVHDVKQAVECVCLYNALEKEF